MNPNDLKSLLVTLSTNHIRFILVGGLAVELCGHHRATYDVDILIDNNQENITKLITVLSKLGEGYAKELSPEDFDPTEGCITIHDFSLQLDIFTVMSGYSYEDLLKHTSRHTINDSEKQISYLNIDGLLLLKSPSARPKDQQDVQALKSLKTSN